MIIRIQGKVTAIDIREGVSAKTGRKWSRKVYTISDDFKNPEYNRSVEVNDFGKIHNAFDSEPIFDYKSQFVVGDVVDIACYIETNEFGFTNVDYGKEWSEIETKKDNVVRPDDVQTTDDEGGDIPF